MTNEMIIFKERCRLYDAQILPGTGRFFEIETETGEKKQLEEPEEIHTFAGWKERGFVVKRGQHAITKIVIWKYTTKKAKNPDEADEERMFQKLSYFFAPEQVEPLQKVSDV